jgi:hypothetical protein
VKQAEQRSSRAREERPGDPVREPAVAVAHRVLEDAQRVAVRGHATVVAVSDPALTHR